MGFEVAYDPCQNIKIVKAIEKYPVIYNTRKYPPVGFKSEADNAWAEVSKELGVSEGYIKARWTNIRGCFKRYLKNKSRSSMTKDYYLASYLHFMLPFMRVQKSPRQTIMHQPVNEEVESNIDVDFDETFEVQLVDSEGEEERFFISTKNGEETQVIENGTNADWDFLSSLLPDVEKMDSEQKAKFRNSLLSAIDMTLYGDEY